MKKILSFLLSICLLLLSCAPMLTSCALEELEKRPSTEEEDSTRRRKTTKETEATTADITKHEHQWGKWETVQEPYCGNDGLKRRVCKCGADDEVVIAATAQHSYGEWTVISKATCSLKGRQTRVCSKCQFKEEQTIPYTEHLYTEVVIPATLYREAYEISACDYCDSYYESAKQAQDIVTGGFDLSGDDDSHAFVDGCRDAMAQTIRIPDTLESYRITKITAGAFQQNLVVEALVLGANIEVVENSAFASCTGLKVVVIPHRVTEIQKYAFENCTNLKHVFYMGSQAEWSKINIGFGNTALTGANIHFLNLQEIVPVEENSIKMPSQFDNNGDGIMDSFTFSNYLPKQFAANGALCIAAENYDQSTSVGVLNHLDGLIPHYYLDPNETGDIESNSKLHIDWTFEVPEDGYYEFCFQMRLKDGRQRGNQMYIDGNLIYQMDYQFLDEQVLQFRDNELEKNVYMSGFGTELTAGTHTLSMKIVPGIFKTFHFRYIYLVKTGDVGSGYDPIVPF